MADTGSLGGNTDAKDGVASQEGTEEYSQLHEGTETPHVPISQELLRRSDLANQRNTFLRLREIVLDSDINIPAFEKTFEIISEDPTNLDILFPSSFTENSIFVDILARLFRVLNEIMNCSLKLDKKEQYEAFMSLWEEGSVGNQYFTAMTNMVMHYKIIGEDYDQAPINTKLRKILSVFNREFSNWHARFTKLVESNQELGTKTGWNPSYDL